MERTEINKKLYENGFDFEAFELENEFSAKNLLSTFNDVEKEERDRIIKLIGGMEKNNNVRWARAKTTMEENICSGVDEALTKLKEKINE